MGRCYNSVVVNKPADEVWEAVKNFHDLSWAPDVITGLEQVGDKSGTEVGAGRVLNGVFHETLTAFDDAGRTFSYSIDDGPEPVAKDLVKEYIGRVAVHPVTSDNTTFIEWESTYTANDDKAVAGFCNPIYQALLGEMKKTFG